MIVTNTKISGAHIIEPEIFKDDRGFFLETFNLDRYKALVSINIPFVQDNHSRSGRATLRGIHFQKMKPQGKLVRVVNGNVFDVIVDIRENSPTLGHWEGIYLTGENKKQIWIPPGLAHGFVVLSEIADFEYKCTDYYDPDDEFCLAWNDPDIGIEWPISDPILSEKDKNGMSFVALRKHYTSTPE